MKRGRRRKHKTKTFLELNTDIKCQFKAHCAQRGKTMTEVLEEMMLEKIRN